MLLDGVLAGVSFFKKNCILVSFYLDLSRNDVMVVVVVVLVSSMVFNGQGKKVGEDFQVSNCHSKQGNLLPYTFFI
jgi:hypothetical protein